MEIITWEKQGRFPPGKKHCQVDWRKKTVRVISLIKDYKTWFRNCDNAYLFTWIRILFAVTQVWPAFRNFAPIRPVMEICAPKSMSSSSKHLILITYIITQLFLKISNQIISRWLPKYVIFRVWIWWLIFSKLFLPATALSKSADWRTWKKMFQNSSMLNALVKGSKKFLCRNDIIRKVQEQ